MTSSSVGRLTPDDAPVYRDLRLEALRRHPSAFANSFDCETEIPPDRWPGFLQRVAVFGAWQDHRLVAMAACPTAKDFDNAVHTHHKAYLTGVYVKPEARGHGFGGAVCRAAIEHARTLPGIDQIMTAVNSANGSALALYQSLGFVAWGRQPCALKVDGAYHDEIEMALLLG